MAPLDPARRAVSGFDPKRTLISHVDAIAAQTPDAPAILHGDRVVNYRELLDRADQFAAAFQDHGAGPGEYVGLCMSRSPDCLAGMLGALRTGAGFVVLDPGYASQNQLAHIAAQVPFAVVLADPEHAGICSALITAPVISPSSAVVASASGADRRWPVGHGADPACLVFTSGTTGQPKGVILSNRGLASFSQDQTVFAASGDDIVMHGSSLACDGGLIEVWPALMNGAALAIVEGDRPALQDIAATMVRHNVTMICQYIGMQELLVDHHLDAFSTVRLAIPGGDIMSPDHARRLMAAHPGLTYFNGYGPSEASCISLAQKITPDLLTGKPIPIGTPMAGEDAFVVDEDLREVPDGTLGQLVISGCGVALGYYKLPEKTAASFIEDPRCDHSGRVFLTGDLAMRDDAGRFQFAGRTDRQIKLAGRRIELDGIEHILRGCDGVHNVIVEVVRPPVGGRRICAALQPKADMVMDHSQFMRAVLDQAQDRLAPEMLPKSVLVVSELPLTKLGKPDRKAVRDLLAAKLFATRTPAGHVTGAAGADAKAVRRVRDLILGVWDGLLGCGALADSVTFFEAGGNSLQLIDAHARIEAALGRDFDLSVLFETPRLGEMAKALAHQSPAKARDPDPLPKARPDDRDDLPEAAIAIIGIAARVPGADTLDEFWQHVLKGDNLIRRFDPDELDDAVDPATRADPDYVPARAILENVDLFDAGYFGILPREAEHIDPQARVFLELCVQALDDAGLDPARPPGPVGVFAGSSPGTYMLNNLMPDRASVESFTAGLQSEYSPTLSGNIADTLATRVAFKLNLKGPALTVQTSCSTSLTAIAQAVNSLRLGQSDVALAGGVSITFPQKRGYLALEGGISSPDGLCRPFDAKAGGTVFGDGAGVLVLKRLKDAVADGDHIEAVIRGVGLNNDGADKISFTAMSVTGQADAIRAAHADAGVSPDSISYVECHATATPLGDPLEIRALGQAFGGAGGISRCALGSVKGNIGHLDAGAGVIGVIKTARMLTEARIPPVANFQTPNPRIDFASGRFFVPGEAMDWTCDGPRRAGVSGFGVGGTNAHLVLQEPPVRAPADADATAPEGAVQILPLSARSPEALAGMCADLARALEAPGAPDLADVAFTLQEGRVQHAYRLAITAATPQEASAKLLASPEVQHAAQAGSHDTPDGMVPPLPDQTDDPGAMMQALGDHWAAGGSVDWSRGTRRGNRKVRLPTTSFQRQRHWVDPVARTTGAPGFPLAINGEAMAAAPALPARSDRLATRLAILFCDLSGKDMTPEEWGTPFPELGFDSLFMGQVARALDKEFGVRLGFRNLLSDMLTINAVARHLDQILPADAQVPAQMPPMPVSGEMADLVQAQLRTMQAIFAQQLRMLGKQSPVSAMAPKPDTILANDIPPGPPGPTGPVPLTESQREIWMTNQLGDLPAASFNEGISIRLAGALHQDALHDALEMLVARHDALRLRFAADGTTFRVAPAARPDLPLVDLSNAPDPKAALRAHLQEIVAVAMDIVAGPPFRLDLVRLSDTDHVLIITAHHIVCDGWSLKILISELSEIYGAQTTGRVPDLPPALSFGLHASDRQTAGTDDRTRAFWRKVYDTVPELPELPTDRPRAEIKSFPGATARAHIGQEVVKPVRLAGAINGCTLFATLFGALQITLGRLGNASDVVLGVPIAGQTLLEDQSLVGHCVNFLPLRAPFDPDEPTRNHLERVAGAVRDALDHSDYTLGTLLRDQNTRRTLSRLPLTEVIYNLDSYPEYLAFGAIAATISHSPKAAVNYDLFFNMLETGGGLEIDVNYNTDLYDRDTIDRWLRHFAMVLKGIADDADQPIKALALLDADEVRHQCDGFNATQAEFPTDAMIPDLVAQRVAASPGAIAVSDDSTQLSYGELARASDALAAHIQASLPGKGARIGVALPRSVGMLVALLAVLKAGHCYVPLDPDQPPGRLRAVLEAAAATGLVSDADDLPEFADGLNIRHITPAGAAANGQPEPVGPDPAAAAYVIFTSGSTGIPKGVEISHRSVVNFLTSMARTPGLAAEDKVLAVTTVMFDIAVLELFLPLSVGGQVVIARREDVLDGFALVQRLEQGDITAMQATPTLWAMLLEAGFKPRKTLKMLAGGEALAQDLADDLTAAGGDLWNMYGPTETTIWSAVGRVRNGQPVTIGAPIANTRLHVLDGGDQICPFGVVGEINIGGEGLALGYFNRPELTGAAFRTVSPGGSEERLYRTGDLAVRLPDGEVQVLGRRDTQVKMRGFRIELEEIEARLRAAPGVVGAAVALRTRKNGDAQLVAYLVGETGVTVDPTLVAEALRADLPDYMVPRGWVVLGALPQTANAKLDRKALPDPDDVATVTPIKSIVGPQGDTEKRILEIWLSVLGPAEISVTDTLFAIGADSLSIFRISGRLIDAGLNLDARCLLAHPTVRKLAQYSDQQSGGKAVAHRPSLKAFRHGARR